MKKIVLVAILAMAYVATFAQDSDATLPKEKKLSHTVGVQMNELIRQVFNFNNSNTNTALNNPFLLYYSVNSVKTGWGIRAGIGYNYQTISDDDGITAREGSMNDLNARLGFEKAFNLSGKFTAGVGVDGVFGTSFNTTRTEVVGFDTTTTDVTSNITTYGGGAMAWLRYNVSKNVQIGTETSFYYQEGEQKQNINIISRRQVGFGNTVIQVNESTLKNKVTEGVFRVPVAFYLLVNF